MKGRDGQMAIVGRDVVSGLPVEMTVKSDVIYEGMQDDLNNIAAAIKRILEKVPPELARDVVHAGIYVTGGSSAIDRLSDYIQEVTNIHVNIAERGSETVVVGLDKVLTEPAFKRFGYSMKSRIFS